MGQGNPGPCRKPLMSRHARRWRLGSFRLIGFDLLPTGSDYHRTKYDKQKCELWQVTICSRVLNRDPSGPSGGLSASDTSTTSPKPAHW